MKLPTNEHSFSTFALDEHRASGQTASPALEKHLAECARCRDYLAELDALEATPPPAWRPSRSTERPRRTWTPSRRALASMIAGTAVFAGVALILHNTHNDPSDGYVGIKGAPAVQVLVRDGDRTVIWDGRSPVRPGNALALRVGCEKLRNVLVVTPSPSSGKWSHLFEGTCPTDGAPLPFTLVPDDEPGEERVSVVLSNEPLDAASVDDAATHATRTSDIWVVSLVFPKVTR